MSIVISNTQQRNNLINRDYAQNSEIILFKCIVHNFHLWRALYIFFKREEEKYGGGGFKEKTPPT